MQASINNQTLRLQENELVQTLQLFSVLEIPQTPLQTADSMSYLSNDSFYTASPFSDIFQDCDT
jgi:hypothetical protein